MSVERWSEEATMAAFERAERACKERTVELEDWVRESGSVVVRAVRGRVERRFRYLIVTGSWLTGGGRGEGASK